MKNDLINWDEPIETVDGEPCEVVGRPNLLYGEPISYGVSLPDGRGCVYSLDGTPRARPEYGAPRIRNVSSKPTASQPQAVQVGDRVLISGTVTKAYTECLVERPLRRFAERVHVTIGKQGKQGLEINREDIHSIEPRLPKAGDDVLFGHLSAKIIHINDSYAWIEFAEKRRPQIVPLSELVTI